MKMSLLSLFDYDIDNKLISVVGAGGKTSFLEVFLQEFESISSYKEKKLLLTSTTKMYNKYQNSIIENNISEISKYKLLYQDKKSFLIFKNLDTINNKLIGFSSSEIDKIYLDKIFNTIITESDGAASMKVKAHNESEPNNPTLTTDVVAIISLDAIGSNVLNSVHRPEIFASITSCNETITREAIVSVFNNNNYYFKNANNAKRHILFNKVDLLSYSKGKSLFQYFSKHITCVDTLSFTSIKNNSILFMKKY